jgi:hypothetical protein
MIKNIKLEVALLSDINGIVALQELYLVSNLSDKEKNLALSPPVHRTSASCNYRTGRIVYSKGQRSSHRVPLTGSFFLVNGLFSSHHGTVPQLWILTSQQRILFNTAYLYC